MKRQITHTNKNILEKSLFEFNKLRKRNKIIIGLFLFLLFISSFVFSTLYQKLSYENAPQVKKFVPSPVPILLPASLSLTASSSTIKKGESFDVTLNINSPNQGVEAANFTLDFDPMYLTPATISAGNFFKIYPKKEITDNQIIITGLADIRNSKILIPKGKGNIAIIEFKALESTESTTILIRQEKSAVASKGINILDKVNNVDIKIIKAD